MVLNFNKSTLSIPDSIFYVGTLVCLLSRCVSLPLPLPFIPFFKYILSCYLARSSIYRLEQLVAIHRQLLRKFAMLELENGESKKKIQVRERELRLLSRWLSTNINKGDSLSLKVGRSFILFCFKALFPCTKVYILSSSYNFFSCLLNHYISVP